MSYQVRLSHKASTDLDHIFEFLESKESDDVAIQVVQGLLDLADGLADQPHRGSIIDGLSSEHDYRSVRGFRFLVIYRIDEANSVVHVVRFWHQRRSRHHLQDD